MAKTKVSFVIVLVTAPEVRTARKLARAALEDRLVACANLIPRIESHYWWRGKIERGNEVLIIFKTTAARLEKLHKMTMALHPYDTPEFIVFPLAQGDQRYLDWIIQSVS
jgi:periplasmic divalent cation tolerance protein